MGLFSVLDDLNKEELTQYESSATVAGEAVTTEVEKEYCAWVKIGADVTTELINKKSSVIIDILLPVEGGRRRVRIQDGKATLTLKRWTNEGTLEEHSEIGIATALTFVADSNNIHVFRRVSYPTDIAESPESKWDIDLFYAPRSNELKTVSNAKDLGDFIGLLQDQVTLPLIKVELEVKEFFTDTIKELIPFEYTDYTPSRIKDDAIQAELAHNWDVVTNWV